MTATRYIICSSNEEYLAACKERVRDVRANLGIATLCNADDSFSRTYTTLLNRHIWANAVPVEVFDKYIREAREYKTMLAERKATAPKSLEGQLGYYLSCIRAYIRSAHAVKIKLLTHAA